MELIYLTIGSVYSYRCRWLGLCKPRRLAGGALKPAGRRRYLRATPTPERVPAGSKEGWVMNELEERPPKRILQVVKAKKVGRNINFFPSKNVEPYMSEYHHYMITRKRN